jgi:hypothetical protein
MVAGSNERIGPKVPKNVRLRQHGIGVGEYGKRPAAFPAGGDRPES